MTAFRWRFASRMKTANASKFARNFPIYLAADQVVGSISELTTTMGAVSHDKTFSEKNI